MSDRLPLYSLDSRDSTARLCASDSTEFNKEATAQGHKGRDWKRAWRGWKSLALASWLNPFLILLPILFVLKATLHELHTLIFTFCILSLIPLVKLHDFAIHHMTSRIGGSRAGLVNATLGNIIEIVIAIIALHQCELRLVHTTLIGSILSKLLLVLGLSLVAGGLKFREQHFNASAASVHTSLLSMSTGAILLPVAYHFVLAGDLNDKDSTWQKNNILMMSRGVSVVLVLLYLLYLAFQLWSHKQIYTEVPEKSLPHTVKVPSPAKVLRKTLAQPSKAAYVPFPRSSSRTGLVPPSRPYAPQVYSAASPGSESTLAGSSSSCGLDDSPVIGGKPTIRFAPSESLEFVCLNADDAAQQQDKEPKSGSPLKSDEHKEIGWALNTLLLAVVTVLVAIIVDFLLESLSEMSTTISKAWIGLIIVPSVRTIAECITAVNFSVKDQVSLSVSVTIGSSIQTALFVIPFMVLLAWAEQLPLGLLFDPLESIMLYIAVQTACFVINNGESNWLDGIILLGLYSIVAVTFWFYPDVGMTLSSLTSSLGICARG